MTSAEIIEPGQQLATLAEGSGIDRPLAERLANIFVPLAIKAASLIDAAEKIIVTDATQVTEIKASRAQRIALKNLRVEVDKTRKAQKEEWLRPGQAIDGLAKYIVERIEPVEMRLEDQEKIAERQEAGRKAALKASREILLAPFGVDTAFVNLSEMPQAQFESLLESSRLAHEARIAAAAKAEADRIAEQTRLAAENERLRLEKDAAEKAAKAEREKAAAEAASLAEKNRKEREAVEAKAKREREAIEAKAAAERAAQEAVIRKEREAREKLEREAAAQKAAADKKAKEEAIVRRKAELAPDKQKIAALAAAIRSMPMPSVTSQEGKTVIVTVAGWIEKLAYRVQEMADGIETTK